MLIYTYSLGFPYQNHDQRLNIRNITTFKSEEDLVKILKTFYESDNQKVFIIEIDFYADKKHINFIKFLVDKIESEA